MGEGDDDEEVISSMSEEIRQIADEILGVSGVTPSPPEPMIESECAVESECEVESTAVEIERNREAIDTARTRAQRGQKKQAEAMLAKNKKKQNSYNVGDVVLLKVIY